MNNTIREIIKNKNLKTIEVIRKVGVAKSYFYDVMNGASIPSLQIARRISDELEVPLDELFPEETFETRN
ncbi:helix-turn-helix transcriptional regulator [Clostridium pasteurianum]|uniref:Putative transcriptional regulator n=1 Tax=Clostridium pasteurianum BC1 TaxID=86416 RepID=R4KBQ8_CLOPA|nr:helix-turn-helix transcriptional regulator [Clostridium pasteurianum]AGK97979.1 putative transcriptional regulator [Clostridium pasteurianum BC1]